jgi:methylated-DNA-[protein]-cysteine S-methyltransferase
VGHANGSNPLPLVIPCHRLVGSQGSLTGYGGGLEMKRWLIAHEREIEAHEERLRKLRAREEAASSAEQGHGGG